MADSRCKRRKQSNPRRKNVDLENMPEDADAEQHVGMRPSLSPPPLSAASPAKGLLLPPSSEEPPLTNGAASEDRPPPPPRINGVPKKSPEDEKIQEYLQRSDTAVIYPEPVGAQSPAKDKAPPDDAVKPPGTPEPAPVIEEPKVLSEYLLKCPHCDQVFSGQPAIQELKEHLAASHKEVSSQEPSYTCQKCNASFTCKENLAKHKLFHVSNGQGSAVTNDENAVLRKFKCNECGKAFKFKHHLKEHIRIHSGEKPFACPNCGKRFSHSGSYSSHMTSKKCLVVNLKVRKVDNRSPRGRGTTQNNSFRPIIPKYAAGAGGDLPLIPAGYMPSSERFSNFAGRPQQPYLPLTFHPLLSSPPHYLPMGAFSEVSQMLHRRYENDCPPSGEHQAHSQAMPPMLPPTPSSLPDKPAEEAPASSPKPIGEMNAVKKILEIVDATVTKQQQSPTGSSSSRPRNGLLSELLSAAPHPIGKSPPPLDARCRFCSRLFDSRVDLHQHERYLCPNNFDVNGSEGGDSGGEESRPKSSSSILSGDSVQTLRAHYQVNPRPKKSEMIRMSRDLKCPTRAVQDWFHSQQQPRSNGELPRSPPAMHQSPGLSFPHYNGSVSSGSGPVMPFRPIPERSPMLVDEEQPLDLSVKVRRDNGEADRDESRPSENEVLNLSQRSSRTPPKVPSPPFYPHRPPYHPGEDPGVPQNHLHSSLLYKYMQMGISGHRQSPQREKSPNPVAAVTPSSPERSPSHAEQPQCMPSPGTTSYADNSSSPGGTTGSYSHADEPADGNPYSPSAGKKLRLWNQAEGDESTLEDSPGAEEDSSGGSGKIRKSWKLHKVESEEGMYACDQCDKMFSKQSSLARHKYEHSGQRPHKCDVCNKAFKHKHHLTEHKRLHSGEKPFQCKKCLKRFSHSGSYSQHMNHRYSYCKPYHE